MTFSTAHSQFHNKTPTGQAAVNQQAIQQARQQAAGSHSMAGGTSSGNDGAGAAYSGGDMILPEGKRQALGQYNPRISRMNGKNADIWGRAIHHTDGSYTESKQDNLSNTLEQETKSKNGVRLQRRIVMLDQSGRPAEVMIYDGRDQFKYRGLLLYDAFGRFVEEQVYDAAGTLIRRKVQEYTPQGLKKPARSWDYVENIPSDLKLVITQEELPDDAKPNTTVVKRGLFGQVKTPQDEKQPEESAPVQNSSAAETSPDKRKGLGRLFGKKDK
ncbi:MAG: hypothetical protein P1U68_08390 [Verrucomicrobiales bacterium]|nr:hypothetical protein [Verrucomicrobiales bacterium]